MKKFSVGAALAVLCFHTAVRAQQPAPPPPATPAPAAPAPAQPAPPAPAPPAPAPAPAPPPAVPPAYPYGPPPGYGTPPLPPPPSYYYYPPPPPSGVWRPFTIALGVGVGWLSQPDDSSDSDPSFDYLARIGFGVTRNWVVFLGLDGAQVSTPDQDVTVTNYLIGAQFFILRRFYVRGGLGLATFSEETTIDDYSTAGQGFLAAAGAELFQGENVAFGVEYAGALSRFSGGSYLKNGLLLALSFY
jgi:Outer membrane protein beta-barrel domain